MKRKIYYCVVLAAFVMFGIWYCINYRVIKRGDIALKAENISNSIDKNEFSSENNNEAIDVNDKININTADAAELSSLKGIGPGRAEDIIKYRNEKGAFTSIEDIMNIKGIGEAVFNRIKNYITVQG